MKYLFILMPFSVLAQPGAQPANNPVPVDVGLLVFLGCLFGLFCSLTRINSRRLKNHLRNLNECLARNSRKIATAMFALAMLGLVPAISWTMLAIIATGTTVVLLAGVYLLDRDGKMKANKIRESERKFDSLMDEARKRDEIRMMKQELLKRIEEKVKQAENVKNN